MSCPDTTITVISLGKEVNELFENALNSVSYWYFTLPWLIQKTGLNWPVLGSFCTQTYLYILKGTLNLNLVELSQARVPWFKCYRLSEVENSAKIKICKIRISNPIVPWLRHGKICIFKVMKWQLTTKVLTNLTKIICNKHGFKL